VVIHDFDICGPARGPNKADAKLIVDANAVLASAITGQGFQAIPWRNPQIVQSFRPLELFKLAPSDRFDASESLDPFTFEKPLGICASER
jgi:hypothetical protein